MNLVSVTQPLRSRKPLGYLAAALLSVVAIWLRLQLDTLFATSPFLISLVAVALATLVGGFGPGVAAAILSGLLADFFLLPPVGSLALEGRYAWVAMAVFAAAAAAIVGLVHGILVAHDIRNESEKRLRELNTELEARVIERTRALETEVAERADAEAQLRQLQKMESIGQLTGGIAHDFNNMLAIVTGSLDLARRRLTGAEHPKLEPCLESAAEGARRAAVLTARLLAFSRQQPLAPQALDANRLVTGMSELLRRTIGEHIDVETVLGGGLWLAFADPAQLESAIINLAVNARDAMPDGGKLTVETANMYLDDDYVRAHPGVEPGQYVMLAVSDTGIGMPAEVVERAFDPFFTTKGVGQGTGLGLSQVFGYVKQSGGHVKIYSEAGQGTAIKLYLPRHLGAAVAAEAPATPDALPLGLPHLVVLVVEDEAQVREMTVDALRELGYTVLHAENGDAALAVIAAQPKIDLLFTDIVMPGMNGRQLADKVAESWPDMRILFTTGYTRNAVVHNNMLDAGVAFLPKPFTLDQLARKVHSAIQGVGANRTA